MKTIRFSTILVLSLLWLASCEDLTELNINPNGVDPSLADPNLLLTKVMTDAGNELHYHGWFHNFSLAGPMQHQQRDGWVDNFNNFVWNESMDAQGDWNFKYSMLRTNNLAYKRAVELDLEFHQGVALVLKSMIFGRITDFWGDIPYTHALMGDQGGTENLKPKYDPQETVYKGIIEDLKTASTLLSKERTAYRQVNSTQDVIYGGDPAKWQRLANSLLLRYYMRLSEKLPAYAEAGVREVINQPLITDLAHEAHLVFLGTSAENSWAANVIQDPTRISFNRLKPCTTLSYKLNELNDPRIRVWFKPVQIPIRVSNEHDENDITVNSVRYLRSDYLETAGIKIFDPATYKADIQAGYTMIDTNSVYVGLPPTISASAPNWYNLNPSPSQGGPNPHVSYMADIFQQAAGPMLKARIFTAAEIYFLKAEAALKGWGSDAAGNYYSGIRASLQSWGAGNSYDEYITNPGVVYNGTLAQIMEQKWISFFTNATEAWFDWRKTGYPVLGDLGPGARRDAIPLRFPYNRDEKSRNTDEYLKALDNLQETAFTGPDGKDSPWSKMWVFQGTGKPW